MTECWANKHGHPTPLPAGRQIYGLQMYRVGAERVKVPWDSLHSHGPTSPPSPSQELMDGGVALGSSWGWESNKVRSVVPKAGKQRGKKWQVKQPREATK